MLVINAPLVWGLNAAAAYAAWWWRPDAGLVAGYAMLVNAAAHLVAAARLGRYNPGLVTATALFLPLGGAVVASAMGSWAAHAAGLGGAVALHAAIAVHALRRASTSR